MVADGLSVSTRLQSTSVRHRTSWGLGGGGRRVMRTRSFSVVALAVLKGGVDATTAKPRNGDPRHGAAGGTFRDPLAARKRLQHQAEDEERSAPEAPREMAPGWSWSSTEGSCREDGEEEGSGHTSGREAEERSPSSQASPWPRPPSGLEDEGGLMAKAEEVWTQLATRIPKELHRRLKLHCVTHDIALMHFVVEAIEEKLGRKARPKKGPA